MGNRNYNQNYNRGGYNGGNNNGKYNNGGGYNGNNQQNYKKSGAVYSKIKSGKNEGAYCVNAWRKTRNGLMKASAFPAGDKQYESGKGNAFMRYAVEISNADAGTHQTYWALMSLATQMIYIKELGLVISPNGSGYTKSGKRVYGYFGKNK